MQVPVDPFTGQPIPPGIALVRCPQCGRVHRADMWGVTQRCAFPDCAYQGPPAPLQAEPSSPYAYLQPARPQTSTIGRIGLIFAIVVLVACAGALIYLLANPSGMDGGLPWSTRTPRAANEPPVTQPTAGLDLPTRAGPTLTQPPLLPTLTQPPVMTLTTTLTPSPTPFTCPGMLPSRVKVGDTVRVCTKQDRLILRVAPSRSAEELVRIVTGTELKILEGPVCDDESTWWRIRIDSGLTGWVREGTDATDPYFICPVK